ncbi:MAG: branched-chain amino acid ABC transporter permease [Nitrospinota bacterium]|nr:MAG: branched-chain amino acid ABC transporter permease [Nitrospinota bacterium]
MQVKGITIHAGQVLLYLAGLVLLVVMPHLLPTSYLFELESGLALAIVGLGFNLLLGYTGLLSFGHGAYFAAGAYTVAMIYHYFPEYYTFELLLPAALITSFFISLLFGFLSVRHTKIFFSILTLSLSMLLNVLLEKFYNITGGSDGLRVGIPDMFGISFEGIRRPVFLSDTYYYVLLVIFCLAFLLMKGIVNSPFGKALQSIRDDEIRARLIGVRVRRYRLYAFIISGLFTGLGGALWSFVDGHVTPEISHWIFSGEIVYMTLLGGFVIFEGPIVGAILFTFLQSYAIANTEYWQFVMGITLILLVLFLPGGVAGGLGDLARKVLPKREKERGKDTKAHRPPTVW